MIPSNSWQREKLRTGQWDHSLDFGDSIRHARLAKGLTAVDLYGVFGTVNQLLKWERGCLPRRFTAERIIPLLTQHLDLDEETMWWTWEQAQSDYKLPGTRGLYSQWANDYREQKDKRNGNLQKRLADVWKTSQDGARNRIYRLFSEGYLTSEDRSPKRHSGGRQRSLVCHRGHSLTNENRTAEGKCRDCIRIKNRDYYVRNFSKDRLPLHPKLITILGESKTIQDWANDPRCMVGLHGFYYRLKKGWNPQQALLTPPRSKRLPPPEQEEPLTQAG